MGECELPSGQTTEVAIPTGATQEGARSRMSTQAPHPHAGLRVACGNYALTPQKCGHQTSWIPRELVRDAERPLSNPSPDLLSQNLL